MSYKYLIAFLALFLAGNAKAQTNCPSPNYFNGLFHPGCLSWVDLNNAFASPPVVGAGQPNAGRFTDVQTNSLEVSGPLSFSAVNYIPNAVGNGSADDTAAIAAACASGIVHFSQTYRLASSVSLPCDAQFDLGATLLPDSTKTVTIAGSVWASPFHRLFSGAGSVVLSTAPWVSVAWWGGIPSASNPELGFRAAAGSNRTIHVPAGSYVMNSTVAAPCCALDPPTVRYTGLSNVKFEADSATFTVSNAIASPTPTTIFLVDSATNFRARGGTYIGNRTGLTSGQESGAWELINIVDSVFEDMRFTGNWGGFSTPFLGDWIVNTTFRRMTMLNAGQCFDFSFLHYVRIEDIDAIGADANGNNGANQIGAKCFSFIYDVPNAGQNTTGYSFTDNDGVTLTGSTARNYLTGIQISSGNHYSLSNNHIDANVGCVAAGGPSCGGAGGGQGLYISYYPSGAASSVGHPPGNIRINGDTYTGNGNTTAGAAGILIDVTDITNSDVISNISIDATFDNNANAAVEANGAVGTKLARVVVNPICSGANQTFCIGANLAGLRETSTGAFTSFNSVPGVRLAGESPIFGSSASYAASRSGAALSVDVGAGDCGTGASVVVGSTNTHGFVLVGSGANGGKCTLHFTHTWANTPVCPVANITAGARPVFPVATGTTLAITAVSTLSPGDELQYGPCGDYQ